MSALYVNHDQTEILTIADRVAVMNSGQIAQESPPIDIYQRPQSRLFNSFNGQNNFIDGKILQAATARGPGTVEMPWGTLHYAAGPDVVAGAEVTVAIRRENLLVAKADTPSGNQISGEVSQIVFWGEALECRVIQGAAHLDTRVHPSLAVEAGAQIAFAVDPQDVSMLIS